MRYSEFDKLVTSHFDFSVPPVSRNDGSKIKEFIEKFPIPVMCVTSCILIQLTIILLTNIGGLFIGLQYHNNNCHSNHTMLTLSEWLVISNSVLVVLHASIIALMTLPLIPYVSYKCFRENENCAIVIMIFVNIFLIISKIYSCMFGVFGIIELRSQYEKCIADVLPVAVACMVNVIINFVSIFTVWDISFCKKTNI